MLALKVVGMIFIGILVASPCNGYWFRNSHCPSQWFKAHFEAVADAVAPLFFAPDKDLTFFKNTMLFSDKKIERVTQNAIKFFKTKYGLDFSESPPNDQNHRFFENAELQPFFFSPQVQFTVNVNSWLLFRKTTNYCFENRGGGFRITFTKKQMLHGTYGRQEGIPINPGDQIVFGFFNINYSPKPIAIHFQSITPLRAEPIDGFSVINCEIYNPTLGPGIAWGVFKATPTKDPGMFHFAIRNSFTFPGHPGLI